MEKFPDVLYVIRNNSGYINALTKMIKILTFSNGFITSCRILLKKV